MLSSFEHLQVLHNLLVAPVKNPPVATNITQPRSTTTFLSLASLSFLGCIVFLSLQEICSGVQRNILGVPRTCLGVPKHILGTLSTLLGVPKHCLGAPRMILGTPWVILGVPRIFLWSPRIFPWRHYNVFLEAIFNIQHLLLNKTTLFHTQNLQLCLIS